MTEAQIHLAQGDVELHAEAAVFLIQIAATYSALGHDDRCEVALSDACDRVRLGLAATLRVSELRRTSSLDAEAATEWRRNRETGTRRRN